MKKKYIVPEMEELEMDEPVVLQVEEAPTNNSSTNDEPGSGPSL